MKRIVYILLLALLLTACGKGKTEDPTVTTDPTIAPTTATAMADVEEFQKLFKEEYWYRRALGCTFEKPEDISLRFYFYTGTGEIGEDDYKYFTSEEQAFLAKAYKDKNGREEYTMATRLPVEKINKALSILGVTLEDVEIPKDWVYYDKTDAYYFWVSDAYIVDGKVTEVERTDDVVKVYYDCPGNWNTQTNRAYPNGTKMVMTLQEKSDGSYLVLSNLPAELVGPVTEDDFTQLFKDAYWYWRALGCTFEKPEDVSAEYFFYMGLSEEDEKNFNTTITSEEQANLDNIYLQKYGKNPPSVGTAIKLPVEAMNKALSILDITIEDIEIPSHWLYYDQTDAYYFWVSDAYGVDSWKVTKVENGTNGIVKVYWEGPQRHLNTATNKFFTEDYPRMVMTLQKKPDGRIFVLSNVPVNNTR